MLLPELEEVGIQGLAGGSAVLKARQVEGVDVDFTDHAVHGRRAAEGGHAVLLDYVQDFFGVEAVEVVGEHAGFHDPLAVVLAPHGLAPARIGDREMEAAVAFHVVPPLGGEGVRDRVALVVHDHLGVAARTAGKVHEHGVGGARLATRKGARGGADFGVEVDPPRTHAGRLADAFRTRKGGPIAVLCGRVDHEPAAGGVDKELLREARAFRLHVVGYLGDVLAVGADDGLHFGAVQAVGEVVFLQHEGGGHHDGP